MKIKSMIDYFNHATVYNGHKQGTLPEISYKKLCKLLKRLEKSTDPREDFYYYLKISYDPLQKIYEGSIYTTNGYESKDDKLYASFDKIVDL